VRSHEPPSATDTSSETPADSTRWRKVRKLMKDMHYEVCIQDVITYNATFLGRKVTKADTRSIMLTWQQYLEVNIEH
jgi:hypothetical protein